MNEAIINSLAFDVIMSVLTGRRTYHFHTKDSRLPHRVTVDLKPGEFVLADNTFKATMMLRLHQASIWLDERLENA